MDILDSFYDIDFSKIDFEERKLSISKKKTILYGPPKSGKSYLIFDYLSLFKSEEYLYIDFTDLKINNFNFYKDIQKFIDQNSIKIVALDNFDFSLSLPKCDSILIATNSYHYLKEFETLLLYPTDFEEFLLFDKHQNITTSFNYFLKFGNLVKTIQTNQHHKHEQLQEHIKLLSNDKTQLAMLKTIINSSGEIKSLNQLYTTLKKEIKISKDRFYNYCKILENDLVISFLPKLDHEKAAKKIYVYNHALISEVSFKKNFNNIFTNMVYLELRKKFDEIYYDDQIDFYIPQTKEIVLSKPFFIGFNISPKILSFIENHNIQKITIVTVSNDSSIYIDNIECEINPFYTWAIK